jgi:hypothetical protein
VPSFVSTPPSRSDLVAIVTDDVSDGAASTLSGDGWRVVRTPPVPNPGTRPGASGRAPSKGGYPQRFWAVYTKLLVFNMTEYSTGEA